MSETPYHKMPGFEDVYLEDSYVLGIIEEPTQVRFLLELVLTEDHPLYQLPQSDDQYCYRSGVLYFPNLKQVRWKVQNFQSYVDAVGDMDYGNIDTFYGSDGFYHLDGDWGDVDIFSAEPVLQITPQSSPT